MSKKATIISNWSRNSRSSRCSRSSRISRLSRLSRSSRTFGSLILLAALLLTACQSDTEDVPVDSRPRTTVELLSYSSPFLEIAPWSTRADDNNDGYDDGTKLPNGYQSYEQLHPHASTDDSTIGVFMTPEATNPAGDFIYQGLEGDPPVSIWKSTIVVEPTKNYWIYGFMPRSGAENATISPLPTADTSGEDQGYAEGAVITLNNYEALTTADVSVIVGLRLATKYEHDYGAQSIVPLGNFSYTGQAEGENRLFVLLKHIYAGLHFATKVDPVYAALRTIRITKVELTAVNIRPTVDLRITLTANSNGTDPLTNVEYLPTSVPAADKTIALYEKTNEPDDLGVKVPVDDYYDFLGCLVPAASNNFVLRTTYDIYDTDTSVKPEGNLIRKGCVAENQIRSGIVNNFPTLQAGELFTVRLLIKPTFLYVLSEPDLDNPTITISN